MAITGLGNNYPAFGGGGEAQHAGRRGRFFASLQAADPATQKQMLSDMASKLRQRAGDTGSPRSQRLNSQADMLEAAAKSGDLSQIQQTWDGGGNWHASSHSSR